MTRLTYPITQTQTIRRARGTLRSARVQAGAGGAATLTLYDGISDSGAVLLVIGAAVSSYEESSDSPRPFHHGLHAVLTGSPTHVSIDVEL